MRVCFIIIISWWDLSQGMVLLGLSVCRNCFIVWNCCWCMFNCHFFSLCYLSRSYLSYPQPYCYCFFCIFILITAGLVFLTVLNSRHSRSGKKMKMLTMMARRRSTSRRSTDIPLLMCRSISPRGPIPHKSCTSSKRTLLFKNKTRPANQGT